MAIRESEELRARSPHLPWLLLAAGLAVLAASTPGDSRATGAPVTLVGLQVQRTEAVTLAPGASRAWPASDGVQGVAVVSGRVTIHGPTGIPTVYGPGQGFAAGWEPYRTVNKTDSPVEMLVTFHAD